MKVEDYDGATPSASDTQMLPTSSRQSGLFENFYSLFERLWFRKVLGEHSYLDRKRVAVMGTNYGGFLAALMLADRSSSIWPEYIWSSDLVHSRAKQSSTSAEQIPGINFFPARFLNGIFDQAEFETEEIFQGPWKTALLWRSHFSNI